eukprot:jgi/Tetstr1/466680/TSEL_011168.t1
MTKEEERAERAAVEKSRLEAAERRGDYVIEAGDGVGWGAVDHLSDVDMVHMPAEMFMETAVPIDFQEAWAEAQRCVNARVVAAVEADDPVVLDRALKWKYLLPQLLLRAPSRGRRRRLHALAWRFRAFAERRMTDFVRLWDDARTEAFYAGHARQRGTDADLFAARLVGTADTVVALVEDGELSRAAGRLSSKGMGDLSDPDILAQLRDKHPSRSHPIPDAAYDIPVDEAALTVDMRVPYQQLKQHVAAGPSGMRNDYLRCLVGEYARASGPAALRAMSEVASMYIQGRMPGWFIRLFASARLVALVKKLGEGRAPNVRHVAVGEAERRAAERAVVDNMKEAYVSVLAPSQLGVSIPAGDSVLVHGVRLIAEKLGPRAVIVHTYLRNAYNEAWRRTIIQRHIDCSPLHPVIHALLASLSTDSYVVVDDRSAPLRSEDGVQHGAPLATASFCDAIHPEVHHCDTTLEVNDGAARFNADDGFFVGLPEHVWPALHAFRTSIKASVGLEVRFDKMQAYIADMEAARREAPADIEWPELDGHHGIAVLNVPLGSPEYVQAYMRGKAEELREEVDASLSKLMSVKPSRRYTHALHHHAWALLKHCMQHKAGYWLRNCLPSEVEAFAEAVDATILAAVERVLGVSFDPSTYGTDTNPVVTDFLAELLHDPDPMAAEVATLSKDAVARARSRLHLPTLLNGAGIRRMATVRDAAFIGCMNAILPRFLTRNSGTNTPTPGFFDPQLGSVLGRGSFNATSSARQYDHFLNDAHGSDSYAAEMREAWGRLQAATAGHLGDAEARQMEREVEAASGSQKELTAFLDQANNSRLRNEMCALPGTSMTPHELREVAAGYFLLPSPCLALVVGSQIILPSTEHNPVTVDLYGDALMNLPAPGDAHWSVQHDAIAYAFRDHCVHDLGIAVRREVDDLFQQAVPLGNTVPRDELKDLVPDAELSLPAFNVVTGSYDPRSLKSTLLEFKTMRYGVKYTSVPRATAVHRFERSLLGDIQRGFAARDAAWHNTKPGQKGPLRDILDMSEYTGTVFGTVAYRNTCATSTAACYVLSGIANSISVQGRNLDTQAPRVKVCIDFGTTYSGFAFASCDVKDTKIYAFDDWPGWNEAGQATYAKTPTVSLYSDQGGLLAYGWEAVLQYKQRLLDGRLAKNNGGPYKHPGHMIEKIKLHLSPNAQKTSNPALPLNLNAKTIIADYLRELGQRAIAKIQENIGTFIQEKDIQWCITVPAIWNDNGKATILKELEAFSSNIDKPYIVVDVGGGTVDIVVHKKQNSDGELKELATGTGDLAGGTFIDQEFIKYVQNKVGINVFKEFEETAPIKYMSFMGDWERSKRAFAGKKGTIMDVPTVLQKLWSKKVNIADDVEEIELSPETISSPFIVGKHKESKKTWHEERENYYADDVFHVFITRGSEVTTDMCVKHNFTPHSASQTEVGFTIVMCDQAQPVHTDEAGCESVGSVTLNLGGMAGDINRSITAYMYFGKTMLELKTVDDKTGKTAKTSIKFNAIHAAK